MATRFVFTTRDWFWLCLVLFLAMGWHTQVRYSALIPIPALNTPYSVPKDTETLQRENSKLDEHIMAMVSEDNALQYDLSRILTDDQKQTLKAAREKRAKRIKDWVEERAPFEYAELRRDNEILNGDMDTLRRAHIAILDTVEEILDEKQKQLFKEKWAKRIKELAESAAASEPQ